MTVNQWSERDSLLALAAGNGASGGGAVRTFFQRPRRLGVGLLGARNEEGND